jgi:succinate dehydrogenase / fumarate reductase flavoprotein subunit
LIEVFVFGMIAGRNAARSALRKALLPFHAGQVEEEKKRVYGIFDRKPQKGLEAYRLRKKLQKLAWDEVGVVREGEGLKKVIRESAEIRDQLSQAYLSSPSPRCNPEWVEYLETLNLVDLVEMMARSALMRQESRGGHYRVDFPDRNDREWLKNIVLYREKDRMKLEAIPVRFLFLQPEDFTETNGDRT